MAEVIPFRGICYDPGKIEAASVMAPPYDVISPEMREILYSRSPYNIARVDAGMDQPEDDENENKYTRSAGLIEKWLGEGVLRMAEKPCLYVYEAEYAIHGGLKRLRGIFALVRLEPFGEGRIYPHECTHSKARNDRLRLITATGMNTSPIFSVYENEGAKKSSGILDAATRGKPYLEARDFDGAAHRLWVIDRGEEIAAFQEELKEKPIFIADGHHRYETALEHQRQMRERPGGSRGDESFNYVLMFLANTAHGGLTVLPTHRLVKTDARLPECLAEHFNIETISPDEDIIENIKGGKGVFGLYTGGKQYRITYKGTDLEDIHPALKNLDVEVLQELVIRRLTHTERMAYEMDAAAAEALVRNGQFQAAFFLNPTSVKDVMEVALSGQRMPPKSTYFYPKIMTGFVMSRV
ncbi:MAG: DUF1015 domain-containing protein [Nitrospiraceae bacterium]|nr:DUF1015 domain-containing protein [Nitrospiraceae bacterium]